MTYCPDHNIFYNGEIDSCEGCLEKQKNCLHQNQGPDKLFGCTQYAGIKGDYNVCYDCGKLIKLKVFHKD